jgi:hypothetical protein
VLGDGEWDDDGLLRVLCEGKGGSDGDGERVGTGRVNLTKTIS